MPRFFLDIADGSLIADEEGQEFADLAAARQEAVKSARSIMREEILKGRLPLKEAIRILDENREVLDVVKFSETIEIIE